jgi:hypothetical protein
VASQAKSLHWHKVDVEGLGCSGLTTFGDGGLELLYGCEPTERKAIVSGDLARLSSAGYRARIIGRNRAVSVLLTNVGTAMDARYVK